MKTLATLAALLLLSGCIPTTDMIQDGHDWIQLTQTHTLWGHNVVSQHRCNVDDKIGGYCPSAKYAQTELVQGPGPQIAGMVLNTAAIVTGTALLMHGLQTQNVARTGGLTFNQAQTSSTLSNGPVSIFRVP
jgi:hypothetical protein